MSTKAAQIDLPSEVKRYKVQYPLSAYTFPREARIHRVRFDDEYIHLELTDGRILSVPLRWIPTLYNASAEIARNMSWTAAARCSSGTRKVRH